MRASRLALLGLLLLTGPARADSILQGLARVHVRVENLPDLVVDAGYDAERIHRDVGLTLGRTGLLVLSALDTEPPGPAVVVTIDAVETPYGALAYHASMELQEDVTPVRAPDVIARGSVWYTSSFGIAAPESLEDDLETTLGLLTDAFLQDAGLVAP